MGSNWADGSGHLGGEAGGHHDLELVEGDEAVAVLVDALDHAPALLHRGLLAEAVEHARQLRGRDVAAAVRVEHLEGEPQVLLVVAGRRGVERRELLQADEAVAVRVRLSHHAGQLVLGGRVAQALEEGGQLRPRDPAVAVGVELAEDPLHLLLRRPRRGPDGLPALLLLLLPGRSRRRRRGARLGGGAAAEQGRHLHLAHRRRRLLSGASNEETLLGFGSIDGVLCG
uniref:Uncharacterized protein n=1 Tax=Triticum urartu TaxID=4572 RepID=A0A8R7U0M2_TRIUA